jgi:teichuronic acid exporter
MDDLKKIAISGSITYWLVKNSVFIFTFIGNLILARIVLPESYGLIAIANSINDIVLVFTSLGLNLAVINLFEENKVKESCLFLAWVLFLFLSLFSVTLYCLLFFYNLISFEIFIILISLAPITCLQLPTSVYLGIYESQLKFKISVFIWSFGPVIGIIAGIFFANLNFQEWSLIIKQIITTLSVFLILFFISSFKFSKNYDPKTMKKILRYSIYIFFQRLTEIPFRIVPVLFLSNLTNKSSIGYFDRSYYFVDTQSSTLSPFYSNVFFSILSKKKNLHKKINFAYNEVFFYVSRLTMLSSLVIFFYSDLIIGILLGNYWSEMTNYLKGFSILFLVLPLYNLKVYTLLSISKTNLIIIANIVSLIFLFLFILLIFMSSYSLYSLTYVLGIVFTLNLVILEFLHSQLETKQIAKYTIEYIVYFFIFYLLNIFYKDQFITLIYSITLVLFIYLKDYKKIYYIFDLLKK